MTLIKYLFIIIYEFLAPPNSKSGIILNDLIMNIKILVATHKPCNLYHDEIYTPIQVGKNLSPYNLVNVLGDNTGDNISEKNPMYCELTALYWAWKNLKDVDYIGLCHYRRYFDFHQQTNSYLPITVRPTTAMTTFNFSIPTEIIDELKKGAIILPKKLVLKETVYKHYCKQHVSKDIHTLQTVVEELSDSKTTNAFNRLMKQNKFSPYNMFIMSWKDFTDYCTWMFNILEAVEKQTDLSTYDPIQKRIYGYMSERLLNVYIDAQQKKIINIPVVQFIDDSNIKNQSYLEYTLKTFIKNISSKLP